MNMVAPKAPSIAAPERVDLAFARALGHGDLDGATACFAKEGCLITPDLTAVRGRERIRPVLAQLIASGAEVTVDGGHLIDGDEVTLVRARWRIRTGREGSRVEQVCDTTLVMQPVEGRWKLIIAAPWGWGDGRV
ncbi:MAG TPA: nuclear transport factor 2 family protein [Solirubrobacterales bacterium]|nr:nuclear transport factor 2 family protein [Solirubrobacterales bacterium]